MSTTIRVRPFALLLVLAVLTRRNTGLRLNGREAGCLSEVLYAIAATIAPSADNQTVPPVPSGGMSLAALLEQADTAFSE